MIEFEEKLDGVKTEIHIAIKEFWRNLSPHTIQVLAGKCDDETAKYIIAQGSPLEEVNQARAMSNLYPISAKSNKKIAKPKFAEYLKKGDGALVVVRSNGFRHKNSPKIKAAIDWVVQEHPKVSIEITENDRYDTFFFHIKKKKEKEEVIEEPKTEETEPNEGA
jgi:hypothetical protein